MLREITTPIALSALISAKIQNNTAVTVFACEAGSIVSVGMVLLTWHGFPTRASASGGLCLHQIFRRLVDRNRIGQALLQIPSWLQRERVEHPADDPDEPGHADQRQDDLRH